MIKQHGLCSGHLVLLISILICSCFIIWLYQDSDIDQYRDFSRAYNKHRLYVEYKESDELLARMQEKIIADKNLDETWLNLIKTIKDKEVQVQLYLRLLSNNPEREEAYEELSFIVNELFPDESLIEEKKRFFNQLHEIKNINNSLLVKYSLYLH